MFKTISAFFKFSILSFIFTTYSFAQGSSGPDADPLCPGCVGETSFFESAGFGGWTAYRGFATDLSTKIRTSPIANRHIVTSCPLYDTFLGGNILPVSREGNFAIRLGNAVTGAESESLERTFTVTPTNTKIKFSYAVVLQDPGHTPQEQPFFQYEVYYYTTVGKRTVRINVVPPVKKVADVNDPYFKVISRGGGPIVYHLWECVEIDVSHLIGRTININFTTADCPLGGHFGYAYIDGFCDNLLNASFTIPASVCSNSTSPVFADGSASYGESSHYWSIEESDANGGRNPSTEVTQTFIGDQAARFDLKAFYTSQGRQFKCNQYYRVKLGVSNKCGSPKESVKLLYAYCPNITAGSDRFICQAPNQTINLTLGAPPLPGVTYSWLPANLLNNPASSQPTATLPDSGRSSGAQYNFTVNAVDASGCMATDNVMVQLLKPLSVDVLSAISSNTCQRGYELYGVINGGPATSTHWSPTGQTGTFITVNPTSPANGTATYTFVAAHQCGTASDNVTLPTLPLAIPSLVYPNTILPNSSNPTNRVFNITEIGLNQACGNTAYNFREYRWELYSRWGDNVATLTRTSPNPQGFPNCSVPNWNGRATINVDTPNLKTTTGALLPIGVYNWVLWYRQSCTGPFIRYNVSPIQLNVIY